MTNTQKFIELARQGGFDLTTLRSFDGVESIEPEEILLQPLAWQAVFGDTQVDYDDGETALEYEESIKKLDASIDRSRIREWGIEGTQKRWKHRWDFFFDLRASSTSIEEALGEVIK